LQKPFRVAELRARLASVLGSEVQPSTGIDLATALKNNWLELWYQPKIALKSMRVCGAEGLIRIRHPEQGILLPEQFLPRPGDRMYRPLSDFVVERSLADWLIFAKGGMTHRLAINVPASVLERSDFVAHVRAHLPRHPRFPGLIVEITEDEATSNPELAREIAVQLKLYDVHVSIDDFGSGFSSMARLKELPFAEIKIDRSFVQGCSTDDRRRAMCQAVLELARRFDITAVAEGVETPDDLKALQEIGYSIAQGFLLGKPMTNDDLIRFHASHNGAH